MGHFVEHRSIEPEDLARLGRANLVQTYMALGTAAKGAQERSVAGFRYCLGPEDLTFSNFAVDLQEPNEKEEVAQIALRLQAIAKKRAHFRVFLLPGDARAVWVPSLVRAGFLGQHPFIQMTWLPESVQEAQPLFLVDSPTERFQVASFMAKQFFWRQGKDIQRQIAEATAATDLSLARVGPGNNIEGAVMLCQSESILGLYNLCVAQGARGAGLGSAMVRSIQRMAFERAQPVTLQCDHALEEWYIRLGFFTTGEIQAYILQN